MERSRSRSASIALLATLGVALAAGPLPAVTLTIDYTYDSTYFFSSGNPHGPAAGDQARAALEAAAAYYSTLLGDTFSAIQTPLPFESQVSTGVYTWNWSMEFDDPSTGDPLSIPNPTVAADEYLIFAGARSLPGSTLAEGGPGGYQWHTTTQGTYSQAEINQIQSISAAFQSAVVSRGETSGFARWGGTLTFDSDVSANWHFDHTTAPVGKSDFYSVALHEIAHTLGFGNVSLVGPPSVWQTLLSGDYFTGSTAVAEYGGPVPLAPEQTHWAEGTTSLILGTSIPQEAALDPTILLGQRKLLTRLEAAALIDLGWEIDLPAAPLDGDYNGDGFVDAADYTVWRDMLGQYVELGSGPDGNGDGYVGPEDYVAWKNNFGTVAASGAVISTGEHFATGQHTAAVPEPSSLLLWLAAAALLALRRRPAAPERCGCMLPADRE